MVLSWPVRDRADIAVAVTSSAPTCRCPIAKSVPPTIAWELLAHTEHSLTRKGAEMRVRVLALPGHDGGHALIVGEVERHPNPLVRIHSGCLYGDALQSADCDCGPELDRAMDEIQREGVGVLIYLEQEGRGAGLTIKARSLRISEQTGDDTFATYRKLVSQADLRNYDLAAECLRGLGLTSVRLLTNNPAKVRALEVAGMEVRVLPIPSMPRTAREYRYLADKRSKGGHFLPRAIGTEQLATALVVTAVVVASGAALGGTPLVIAALAGPVTGWFSTYLPLPRIHPLTAPIVRVKLRRLVASPEVTRDTAGMRG